MNLNHLMYFRVLCKTLHYQRAAFQLAITQPALSYAINSLEKELGFELFQKRGRNIELSSSGTIFLGYVNTALEALEEGTRKGREYLGHTEDVVISSCSSCYETFLLSLVEDFSKDERYAGIAIRMQQASTHRTLNALINGSVDLGFCTYVEQEERIAFYPVKKQKLVLIVSVDSDLRHHSSITLTEVGKYPLISFSKFCATRQFVEDRFIEENIVPQIVCDVEGTSSICGLVERNIGIAIVLDSPLLKSFKLSIIPLEHKDMSMQMCLAIPKNRKLSPQCEAFKDFVLTTYIRGHSDHPPCR